MARQQVDEFVIDFNDQKEWGGLIAVAFFLAGVGAGAFFLSLLLEKSAGLSSRGIATLGLLVVAIGAGGAFILDLGKITRAWRALANPLSSWISRGVTFIVAFVVFGILALANRYLGLGWSDGLVNVFQILAMIAAFAVMVYSGFVLVNNPGLAFWNNALLPVLFVLYGFMGGVGIIFITVAIEANAKVNLNLLETIEIWLIVFAMLLLGTYLLAMATSTVGARKAVTELLKGRYALLFLGVGLGLGLVVPLVMAITIHSTGASLSVASVALIIAGILELLGGFAIRYSFLRAAKYAPLL